MLGWRQSRRNRASAHQQEDGQKKPLGLDKQAVPNKTLSYGSNTFQMGLCVVEKRGKRWRGKKLEADARQ